MLEAGDRVVVAVSGGPDSMALLKALHMISNEYRLTLFAAHLNHGMRLKDADRDEEYVREFSLSLGVAFESKRIDVLDLRKKTGGSLEETGRDERYRFLRDVAEKYEARKIALGHHLHDQAETIIMNFLRGSGVSGLKGMTPVREGVFIRPLLYIDRKEILRFLEKHHIHYMSDSSNEDTVYVRNRIRNWLVPELKRRFNPRIEENITGMAEIMRLENDYMNDAAAHVLQSWGIKFKGDEIRIKISDLMKQHPAVRNRIIKNILERFTESKKGIGHVHVRAFLNLACSRKTGTQSIFPCGIHVWREYDLLCICRRTHEDGKGEEESFFAYTVSIPDIVRIHELGLSITLDLVDRPEMGMAHEPNLAYMDFEKIVPPLVVRNMRAGDRVQLLGMKGTKKLKSYFIDEKVPRRMRRNIPLLADGDSIIWIAGMRMSERVKITKDSRIFFKVEIV